MIATAVVGQSGGRLLLRIQSSRHVLLIICLHSFSTSMEADMSHVKDLVYLCRGTGRTSVTSHSFWKSAKDFDSVAAFLGDK